MSDTGRGKGESLLPTLPLYNAASATFDLSSHLPSDCATTHAQDMKTAIILCAIIGAVWCDDESQADNKADDNKVYDKRSLYSEGYGYGWPSYGGYDGWRGGDDGWKASPVEITKEVPVIRHVAVPVPHPVPVVVPQPIPVHVPEPVPVHVPVAVPVLKRVPYPVERPVPYPVEKPYPVEIIKKIPYPVPKPYPVHVPVYKVKHIFLQPTSNKWW